jgi:beta-lactamase regulating signal transducer with metallopeptidase domain
MMLLLESALRSLLLGMLVWALLKLLRVRDTATETIIWTVVLTIALSMPLLSRYLPGLSVEIPQLSAAAPAGVGRHLSGAAAASVQLAWVDQHGQSLLLAIYGAGLLVCLMRLLIGLILTWRLYLRATPVAADWARGRRIRASAALKSPASLARIILLPADHAAWSVLKREAVLAHEEAHIARGDFFVQLAAALHCAIFWFSPFAWWLQAKLAEIAETASDAAAVRRLNDRITYAEILLEVARCARPSPSIVAMAKGPLIQQRIDRILCATPNRNLSPPLRVLVAAGLTLVALTVATARATVGEDPASTTSQRPLHIKAIRSAATTAAVRKAAAAHRRRPVGHSTPPVSQVASKVDDRETVSYNPRALLDPVYITPRAYVPASTIVHAGKSFYIRSTERPVISIADGK